MTTKLGDRIRFDKRVAQLQLEKGKLDREDWGKHLDGLPDTAGKAESLFKDSDEAGAKPGSGSKG